MRKYLAHYIVHIEMSEFAYGRFNRLMQACPFMRFKDYDEKEVAYEASFPDGSSLLFTVCGKDGIWWDDAWWKNKEGTRKFPIRTGRELGNIQFDADRILYEVRVRPI